MTVLVTGGAGYIGSHMVHALADAGEPVVVLDNLSTGFRAALPASVPLFVGDVGDQDLVASIIAEHKVNAIIHFAGSIVVPDSLRDPLGYYRNNTVNTRALIEAAVQGGVKHFIFSSTAAVYGNPAVLPVREDAPTRPMSPYGTSKLMSEIMLHDVAAAHDLRYVILRYFNVAGADPEQRTGQSTPAATHLIKVGVETALGMRPKLDVFGTDYPTPDGTCIRDYIHVSDLARAHSAALAHLRARRRGHDLQLRLWPRLFGAGGDRRDRARDRPQASGADGRPPPGRSGEHCRRREPHPLDARLDAAIRRPRHHRVACGGLGAASAGSAQGRAGCFSVRRLNSSPSSQLVAAFSLSGKGLARQHSARLRGWRTAPAFQCAPRDRCGRRSGSRCDPRR